MSVSCMENGIILSGKRKHAATPVVIRGPSQRQMPDPSNFNNLFLWESKYSSKVPFHYHLITNVIYSSFNWRTDT
jgi:hypothetical protein